ncbi:unnamed protein product, partial [Agarophyton chilense]
MLKCVSPACVALLVALWAMLATGCAAKGAETMVTFTATDISSISLYGPSAVYRPQWCPTSVSFAARARALPELADNKIGVFTSDVWMDGQPCTSPTSMLQFTPIGRPQHLPPQWAFEDSARSGKPVNMTCGQNTYGVRYGYLNDVKTESGFLDERVVYLDFAVIPNTLPFAFCSYAARRSDAQRPAHFAPFPTLPTWSRVRSLNQLQQLPPPSPPPLLHAQLSNYPS